MAKIRARKESSGAPPASRLRVPRFRWILLGLLGLLAVLWAVPTLIDAISGLDELEFERPYLLIFLFVAFDAVVPIFPSESLLTTASTLAGQEGSDLEIGFLILAGGAGAAVGDSMLYWISRTVGQGTIRPRLEKARENPKVEAASEVLGQTAPLLIVVGRFVPGVRFVVSATMGIGRYPYSRFLLFSTIGSFSWAAYTCLFSFFVGTALSDYPVLSIATSVVVTTALLAILYIPMKRRYERARAGTDEASGREAGGTTA